jgi:hypothetical protein
MPWPQIGASSNRRLEATSAAIADYADFHLPYIDILILSFSMLLVVGWPQIAQADFMRPEFRQFTSRRCAWAKLHTVFVLWIAAVVTAFGALAAYSRTPQAANGQVTHWPGASALHSGREATLLMFLHPHCPYSRASLEQFHRILAQADAPPHASIIFVRPKGMPEGWERSDLWDAAAKIPGVEVHVDVAGAQARRFGVTTSGAVILADRFGKVLFQGGITAECGDVEDNAGADAVLSGIKTGRPLTTNTAVFGCSLFE